MNEYLQLVVSVDDNTKTRHGLQRLKQTNEKQVAKLDKSDILTVSGYACAVKATDVQYVKPLEAINYGATLGLSEDKKTVILYTPRLSSKEEPLILRNRAIGILKATTGFEPKKGLFNKLKF